MDGSVMMIGRGGSACERADHRTGITEYNDPKLYADSLAKDFGDNGDITQPTSYAINLRIR